MASLHHCDGACVCPVHGTPLIYWPYGDMHACQDITCIHGHGLTSETLRDGTDAGLPCVAAALTGRQRGDHP
jgi:hypothetical protein